MYVKPLLVPSFPFTTTKFLSPLVERDIVIKLFCDNSTLVTICDSVKARVSTHSVNIALATIAYLSFSLFLLFIYEHILGRGGIKSL